MILYTISGAPRILGAVGNYAARDWLDEDDYTTLWFSTLAEARAAADTLLGDEWYDEDTAEGTKVVIKKITLDKDALVHVFNEIQTQADAGESVAPAQVLLPRPRGDYWRKPASLPAKAWPGEARGYDEESDRFVITAPFK